MNEKKLMQRRTTRGLILLGSAVAVVATPIWMAAQQQTVGTAPATGASTPPGVTQPDVPLTPAVTAAPTITPATPTTGPGANGKGPTTQAISVRFKDASIDAVLEHLSKVAGYSVIKTVPIDGRVTVWSDQPITPEKAVELLNSLLKDRGYTAIVQGSVLKVGQISDIKKQNVPVHISADPTQVPINDDLVTWVIPVRTVDAVKLKTDLAPLVSANADLSANGGSNSIIITDTNANVHRIVDIVANLDKHDATENDIIVQHLIYADATATAKLITEIFAPTTQGQQQQGGNNNAFSRFFGGGGQGGGGGRGQGGGGFGGGGFGGGGPGGGQGGGATGATGGSEEGRTGTVTASADTRTNTIVVTGPKDTLVIVKERILEVIDKNPVIDQVIFPYRVKNGQAVDIAATINTLFGANVGSSGSSRSSNSTSTGNRASSGFGSSSGSSGNSAFGSTSLGGSSSGRGSSSGSSNNNSSQNRNTGGGNSFGGGGVGANTGITGVSGPTADLAGQVEVVADADTNSLMVVTATRYQQQVIDLIAELDRPVRQVLIKVLIAEVTHDRSDDLGVDFSMLNLSKGLSVGANQGNVAAAQALVAAGGGNGLAVNLVESQLTSTFHALAKAGKLDVLSRPYILTSDNQEASILVGQEVPFVTNTRTDTLGGTTSSIQYQDIGILLDVTPHVNAEGLVVMDVAPQISSQSDQSLQLQTGVTSPVFNQRSASSRVGVRDGDTIVIGGLMQDQKTMSVTKIPLLGDIPYLGLLFQRDQVSKTKTELLIFLTPHVAQAPDKLPAMSDAEINRLRLTPGAVQPGTFEEHMKGLQAGGSTTQPAIAIPKPEHDRDAWEPEPKMP